MGGQRASKRADKGVGRRQAGEWTKTSGQDRGAWTAMRAKMRAHGTTEPEQVGGAESTQKREWASKTNEQNRRTRRTSKMGKTERRQRRESETGKKSR